MKRIYWLAAVAIFGWSTMATVIKILLKDMPQLQTMALSGLFAFLFLLAICLGSGAYRRMREYGWRDYLRMVGLGFVGMFLYALFYFYGIGHITARDACIINYLWPVMIVLFSRLILKEPLTPRKLVAIGTSFLGVVILSLGNSGDAGDAFLPGAAACLCAAVCYGIFAVGNKKYAMDQTVTMTVVWGSTTVLTFVVSLIFEDWVSVSPAQIGGLLWMGIPVNAIAYFAWAVAINGTTNSAKVANLAYLTPFLSMVISAVVLHERITWAALVALVFIIGGILLQSGEREVAVPEDV